MTKYTVFIYGDEGWNGYSCGADIDSSIRTLDDAIAWAAKPDEDGNYTPVAWMEGNPYAHFKSCDEARAASIAAGRLIEKVDGLYVARGVQVEEKTPFRIGGVYRYRNGERLACVNGNWIPLEDKPAEPEMTREQRDWILWGKRPEPAAAAAKEAQACETLAAYIERKRKTEVKPLTWADEKKVDRFAGYLVNSGDTWGEIRCNAGRHFANHRSPDLAGSAPVYGSAHLLGTKG